eukprot:2753159-Pleurochrysis_carterae.AAC.2
MSGCVSLLPSPLPPPSAAPRPARCQDPPRRRRRRRRRRSAALPCVRDAAADFHIHLPNC